MKALAILSLPLLALGSLAASHDVTALETRQSPTVNATVEYEAMCKSCPYSLCTNVYIPWYDDVVTLTCWTEGETVGDTSLWLKTTDNCFLAEFDLVEQEDLREKLPYCGEVPLDITRQDATVRYLSECKWGYDTSAESILFYGRDQDITLTCYAQGGAVLNDSFWYKTTDNCHVSGSGLWEVPDLSGLDDCGPEPGPRINETSQAATEDIERRQTASLAPLKIANRDEKSQSKRWLQPEQIGEEYASCYTCPSFTVNSTCKVETVYEFDEWVVSQCTMPEEFTYPNGTRETRRWMLTTDWCYVEDDNFWIPPWDNYRYPRCTLWDGY
jgi:hypothetical protein